MEDQAKCGLGGIAGKVALVTGASRGMGLATATELLERGAQVIGCARGPEELMSAVALLKQRGLALHPHVCDVSSEANVDALFAFLEAHYRGIDILVNNAGLFRSAPVSELSVSDFDAVMAVNVRAVFLCARASFRLMARNRGGVIVNVASLAGVRGVEKFPGTAAYVASKSAVVGLTEVLALEGRAYGIRVNAISPGGVATRLLEEAGVNLRAGAMPEEIARHIVWLASSESAPMTGTNLEVFCNG